MEVVHAETDFLQSMDPEPPFAPGCVQWDPVPVLLLEVMPHRDCLLIVVGVTDVEDLGAVRHWVRPRV